VVYEYGPPGVVEEPVLYPETFHPSPAVDAPHERSACDPFGVAVNAPCVTYGYHRNPYLPSKLADVPRPIIVISPEPNAANTIDVTVVTTWTDGSGVHESRASTVLTNWKKS
jgi:hypothetical protein